MSSDLSTENEITWTNLLEANLSKLAEKSHGLSILHMRSSVYYSRLSTRLDLPSIILQIFNGAFSIGSASVFGDNPKAPIIIGIIGLITASMNSITSYFGWLKRSETHKNLSIQYSKLNRFITIEMGLPRDERMSPRKLLKIVNDTYDSLHQQSPLIPNTIVVAFNKEFSSYKSISKPEITNGLEKVIVYKEEYDTGKKILPIGNGYEREGSAVGTPAQSGRDSDRGFTNEMWATRQRVDTKVQDKGPVSDISEKQELPSPKASGSQAFLPDVEKM